MRTVPYVVSDLEADLLNKLPGSICIFQEIEDDVIMIFANEASKKVFGIDSQELMEFYNGDIYEFVHPEDKDDLRLNTRKMLRGSDINSFTYRIKLNGNDDYSLINERWSLVRKDEDLLIGMVAMSDFTKEMKNHEAKLRLLSKKYDDAMKNKARADTNLMTFIQFDMDDDKIIGGDYSDYINEDDKHRDIILKESNNIVDENQKVIFINTLTEDYLKECAYSGSGISLTYKRRSLLEKDTHIWVRLDIHFSDNPINNHNIAYLYLYDINNEVVTDTFLKYAVSDRYDFIQRVDLKNDRFTTFLSNKYKNQFLSRIDGYNYFNEIKNERIFGYKYFEKIKEDLDKERLKEYLNQNEVYSKDFTIIEDEGLRYKKITIKYVDDSEDAICLAQQDLTESMMSELDKNIRLELALNEAKNANRIKTEFLANMSHDMRTPMNAIIGLSNFGLEETHEIRSREYFKQIIDSSEYLLDLLNDLLDMNKLESGSVILNEETVNINSLIEEIKNIVMPKANNKEQELTINVNNPSYNQLFKMDKQRIQQVIINVLTNAIKYTKRNGYINWDIAIEKDNDKYVLINKISDNGVGIKKEHIPYIFDAFYQEKNLLSSKEGGSGLGLAITKNLLELMKGDISCVSEPGKGSEFTIKIPIDIGDSSLIRVRENAVHYDFSELSNKKILVCEDNAINAKIVKKMLEQKGMNVELASNGKEAYDLTTKNSYDCIVMDIKMPIMDGIEAAKAIRMKDKRTPILALSANAYEEDKKESLKAGMNDHIAKPIKKEQLYESLIKNIKDRDNG